MSYFSFPTIFFYSHFQITAHFLRGIRLEQITDNSVGMCPIGYFLVMGKDIYNSKSNLIPLARGGCFFDAYLFQNSDECCGL